MAPIGLNYGYYSTGYTSGAAFAASRTAAADAQASVPVTPVEKVPKVFSNEETERIPYTPKQLQDGRNAAYEIMNAQNPRSAERLNAPSELKSENPTSPEECETCKHRTYVDGSNEGNGNTEQFGIRFIAFSDGIAHVLVFVRLDNRSRSLW